MYDQQMARNVAIGTSLCVFTLKLLYLLLIKVQESLPLPYPPYLCRSFISCKPQGIKYHEQVLLQLNFDRR